MSTNRVDRLRRDVKRPHLKGLRKETPPQGSVRETVWLVMPGVRTTGVIFPLVFRTQVVSRRHVSNPHDSVLDTGRDLGLSSRVSLVFFPTQTDRTPDGTLVTYGGSLPGWLFPHRIETVTETVSLGAPGSGL